MWRRPSLPRVKTGRLGVLEGAASRASFESLPPLGGAGGGGSPAASGAVPRARGRPPASLAGTSEPLLLQRCLRGGRTQREEKAEPRTMRFPARLE